jgi:hypothetical protein
MRVRLFLDFQGMTQKFLTQKMQNMHFLAQTELEKPIFDDIQCLGGIAGVDGNSPPSRRTKIEWIHDL